jgi:sec-independent protein translocase protein TatA
MLPGGTEWLIVLALLVLLFGAKKIPELAKGMGHGIKEFKKATKEIDDNSEDSTEKEQDKQK